MPSYASPPSSSHPARSTASLFLGLTAGDVGFLCRYYTELLQLYAAIGIPFYQSSGDGCFQDLHAKSETKEEGGGSSVFKPYFRFGNFRMFGLSLPYVRVAPWSGECTSTAEQLATHISRITRTNSLLSLLSSGFSLPLAAPSAPSRSMWI